MPYALLNNPGFELQTVGPSAVQGPVHGWVNTTTGSYTGVYAPGAASYTSGAPEGSNVAFLYNSAALAQYLPYKIVEGATYTVGAQIGWTKLSPSPPNYALFLYAIDAAGTTILLTATGSPGSVNPAPVQDAFVTASIVYTADATHVGKRLMLGVDAADANQVDVDTFALFVDGDPTWGGNDVWLDELDPGAAPAVGTWTDYEQPTASQFVDGFARGILDASQQYQWQPNLPVAGTYEVSVLIPFLFTSYSTDVDYTIINSGPAGNVKVNQDANKFLWVDLGTYDFEAGSVGYVQTSGGLGLFVVADAVAWHQIAAPDVNVPIPGVKADTGLGPLALRTSSQFSLPGNESDTGLGSLGIATAGNAFAFINGVGADSQLGLLGLDVDTNVLVPVMGAGATSQLGAVSVVIPGQEVSVPVTGVQASSELGSLDARVIFSASISGVFARMEPGELEPVIGSWVPKPEPNTSWQSEPSPSTVWFQESRGVTEWQPGPKARK